MTWGHQNSEQDAHQQLDLAVRHGINFIDTAEMYPVPPNPDTQGLTETYIGNWLTKTGQRDQLVIATKVAAPGHINYIRDNMALDWRNIHMAIDKSLERLQTDYIDLYQIHWPHRRTNFFGQLGYQAAETEEQTPIIETLEALADIVKSGKVRYIGVSNETPWGLSQYLNLAEKHNLPRIATIQNPYSLLNRSFEQGLAEFSHREDVTLLPYSPLAFGSLTGKYLSGQRPEGARLTLYPQYVRFLQDNGPAATQAYVKLARDHGLDPAQMALAFVNSRSFVGSTIIGATSLEQLESNINSIDITLNSEVLEEIESIHKRYTYPCP
jgi:aryl-alcohol dehydrogenase-like predicted oxidoreductase